MPFVTRVLRFLASIALASCVVASASFGAETTREVLDRFGFFGTWAIDCDAPASLDNVVRNAVVSGTGDPMFAESLGPDSESNIYVILHARRINDDQIALRIKLNGERAQELVMRREDTRIRTVSNRELHGGRYVVKDGHVRGSGRPTPWLKRCGDSSARPGELS